MSELMLLPMKRLDLALKIRLRKIIYSNRMKAYILELLVGLATVILDQPIHDTKLKHMPLEFLKCELSGFIFRVYVSINKTSLQPDQHFNKITLRSFTEKCSYTTGLQYVQI